MLHGIGTDLVEIERIRLALLRHGDRFARRVLADSEYERYQIMRQSARDAAPYVAKRFAAKEAFFKALRRRPSEANTWHQLSIENDEEGRPACSFGLLLDEFLRTNELGAVHVSLSDERGFALAFVTIERVYMNVTD